MLTFSVISKRYSVSKLHLRWEHVMPTSFEHLSAPKMGPKSVLSNAFGNLFYSEKLEDILERLEKHAAVEKIEAQSDGIHLPDEIDIRVTRIGVACVDSNNEPADAKAIWEKLDKARKSLNLENSIHLISLAIPEELISQMRTVNFETFFDEFEKLEKDEVSAMKAIGITKADLIRKQSGQGKLLDW